ncbi:MAG TPA: hypothetical protein PL069_11445, partial [Saprospiraceae bacterium]|nr:hypothetical protein [Saprospiraceae bacterium]
SGNASGRPSMEDQDGLSVSCYFQVGVYTIAWDLNNCVLSRYSFFNGADHLQSPGILLTRALHSCR